MRVWRLSRSADPAWSFSGDGARLYPGRWNGEGVPVVYASEHLSLAALELLVHATATQLRVPYHAFAVEVPDEQVEVLPARDLPAGWDAPDSPASTQALGSRWARSRRSLALVVPSAVVPLERNAVLNPLHPAFAALQIAPPEGFSFDPRVAKERAHRRS